jgi:hypothetical protein
VKDDVLFQRGWVWPTEGDAAALLETSKYMVEGKMIPKPLAWSQVQGAFALASVPVKAAWEKMGRSPHRRLPGPDAKDLRGARRGSRQLERAHVNHRDQSTQRSGTT